MKGGAGKNVYMWIFVSILTQHIVFERRGTRKFKSDVQAKKQALEKGF
jgi:hypothetical protein